MTKRAPALLLLAALLAFASPLHADFSSVARAIDGHGLKRLWIPFLGMARVFVWIAHPKGVHDFQLVTYEDSGPIDPRELQGILQSKAGPGFKLLVRVWSRRSKEWSFIYARPAPGSSRVELMILTHDDSDTVLVRVDIDAQVMARELDHPRHVTRIAQQ
jgi:hypothetical protein